MQSEKFSIRSRIRSFSFAIAGLRRFVLREHNARIHLAATIAVIIVAIVLGTTHMEAVALSIVTAGVWIAELLNTSLERLADLITLDQHPEIKIIKDLAAAAVLIAAIAAVITGLLIFIPKIL